MKVYTSKYRSHWISPYTILEKIFFWREIDYDEPIIDKLSNILNPFCTAWMKFLDFVHPRINYIKIDYWDVWNMDNTLSPIILPMLKQLKEVKHGSPFVDLEDVPEYMRTSDKVDYDYEQKCFDFYKEENVYELKYDIHDRWNWVLDEMIFAFECKVDDSWEEEFYSGQQDVTSVPCKWDENGKPTLFTLKEGPNHTYKCDYEGMRKVQQRIDNGFRLFGKYYQGLWD